MPPEALQLITEQILKISEDDETGLLTLGMLLAISSSSAATVATIHTLNNAYEVQGGGPWWKVRLTAILLTMERVDTRKASVHRREARTPARKSPARNGGSRCERCGAGCGSAASRERTRQALTK
jgi:hypothetical protein